MVEHTAQEGHGQQSIQGGLTRSHAWTAKQLLRVTQFDELESSRLIQHVVGALPEGSYRTPVPVPADGVVGTGLIEGWRGPVLVALESGLDGTIRRCHPHDPSWQNWPLLEQAIIGNEFS